MNSMSLEHRTPDGLSPTNVLLLRNPLDFVAEDHLRLRMMCTKLDHLNRDGQVAAAELAAMLEYLTQELPLLLDDEDIDLMPRVLRRADPEDELPKLAKRLDAEHREISGYLQIVVPGLEEAQGTGTISAELEAALHNLSSATRRHLILENAVLLPLARARLTQDDLYSLRLSMLKRRGLDDLFDKQPTAETSERTDQ